MHSIDKSTICRVIHRVVGVIIENLLHSTICWPQNTHNISQKFREKGGFPRVCGCVDGTLIKLDAPIVHEDTFIDRHGDYSLNVMMICGPYYEFFAINAS